MSGTEESDVPSLIRQRELVDSIGGSLPEEVEGDWVELEYETRRLSMYAQGVILVRYTGGAIGYAFPPVRVAEEEKRLREIMYQEDVGTWFSATWIVARGSDGGVDVRASFNYDDEPNWDDDIHPGLYGIDLEDFPRSAENIPGWLSSLLAEAEEAEARKRAKAKNGGK